MFIHPKHSKDEASPTPFIAVLSLFYIFVLSALAVCICSSVAPASQGHIVLLHCVYMVEMEKLDVSVEASVCSVCCVCVMSSTPTQLFHSLPKDLSVYMGVDGGKSELNHFPLGTALTHNALHVFLQIEMGCGLGPESSQVSGCAVITNFWDNTLQDFRDRCPVPFTCTVNSPDSDHTHSEPHYSP